ncbi:menaquinone biosynthetic enzyme MqnA/MqnD family protein [Anaerosinus gibii]|uniref:Chorismate dehydratase n=1 Tax=Selenobaculum gibii TaxID=3054208 RepID=A0A9Y2AKM9_9FIRM|nr:menaquinone biosynthesis protein [Selenobaculum gbiensis]WIW71518.1 menaquinone biosynthesis protein [Selenobaculum gbiensis]
MGKAKLGHINFINCLPLTYSFEKEGFGKGLNITSAVPTVLNNDIVNNRLDVSPVSSIVYARNSEKFLIMPDVAISADGNVQSIILVSKKPIEELTNDKIILTAKSATSHCLLKIVLNKAYGARPNYYIRIIDMNRIIPEDATATLLIGDDALYANHNHQEGFYYYDIGMEWKKLTGLRMVYAVWIINRNFAKSHADLLQLVFDRVTKGFANGYQKKKQAIEMILNHKPFSFAQLDEYLEVIKWGFSQEHQRALLMFYEMAHEMNLIDHVPKIELAEVIR